MADYQDQTSGVGGTGNQDAWIQAAQAYLAQGGRLDNSGMWDPARGKFGTPAGYRQAGNQLVKDSMTDWNPLVDLLGIGGMGALGALLGPTVAATSAPAASAAFPTIPDLGALSPTALPGYSAVTGASAAAPSAAAAYAPGSSLAPGSPAPWETAAGGASNASPLMKTLAGIGGLAGGYVGQKLAGNGVPPQLSDLLDQSLARMKAQNPTFNAVNQGTWTMLPDYAKAGLTPPGKV